MEQQISWKKYGASNHQDEKWRNNKPYDTHEIHKLAVATDYHLIPLHPLLKKMYTTHFEKYTTKQPYYVENAIKNKLHPILYCTSTKHL